MLDAFGGDYRCLVSGCGRGQALPGAVAEWLKLRAAGHTAATMNAVAGHEQH